MAYTPSPLLVFSRPPATGGLLVFGAADEPPPPDITTGSLQASAPAPSASASGSATTVATGSLQANAAAPSASASGSALAYTLFLGALQASATAPSASASGSAQYNSLTERPTTAAATARHQVATPSPAPVQTRHGIATPRPALLRTQHQNATTAQQSTQTRHSAATPQSQATRTGHAESTPAQRGADLPHQDGTPIGQATSTGHAEATPAQRGAALPHQDGTPIWQTRRPGHQDGKPASTRRHARHQTTTPRRSPWQARHQDGRTAPAGMPVFPPPPGPAPGYVPNPLLVFACPPAASGLLVFGHTCFYLDAANTVPIKRVYMTINRIDLHNLDTNTALPAYDFSLAIDADSWTWTWSATLHRSAAALVQPLDELQATINGMPYRVAVGKVARSKRFPTDRLQISGRGIAQELADPHAPIATYSTPNAATAQQLMAQVLSVNGVPLGWDLDWQIDDWLIPANAWTFQGTAMQALADIAQAAGAYIQPHPTARTLRVLPRYPVPPWQWGSITPDLHLPAAVCATESTDVIDRPAYNRVFVGGTSVGVFGPVTRSGTAGNKLAPQVAHALITDAVAQRQRGIAELSDTGRQTQLMLSLPVLSQTGIILPGTMVRHAGEQIRTGIVRSTALTWDSPTMRQTIGLECHAIA